MSGTLNRLGVVRVAPRGEAPRAAAPPYSSWRFDLTVDGATVLERIAQLCGPYHVGDDGLAPVADGDAPSEAAAALRSLAGEIERDPAWSVLAEGCRGSAGSGAGGDATGTGPPCRAPGVRASTDHGEGREWQFLPGRECALRTLP
jgi:hypothetical protein